MNTNQTLSQNEKDHLNALSLNSTKLDGKDLIRALFIFIFLFFVFAPKIYVSGQIYYLSCDITKINSHLELLEEENKHLKQELEDFRFQQNLRMEASSQILD